MATALYSNANVVTLVKVTFSRSEPDDLWVIARRLEYHALIRQLREKRRRYLRTRRFAEYRGEPEFFIVDDGDKFEILRQIYIDDSKPDAFLLKRPVVSRAIPVEAHGFLSGYLPRELSL